MRGSSRRSFVHRASLMLAAGAVGRLAGLHGQALAQTPGYDANAVAQVTQQGFSRDSVRQIARELAMRPFTSRKLDRSSPFVRLTYDQYRDIRFNSDHAIWQGEKLGFELQLFAVGWLFDMPVDVFVVEGAQAQRVVAEPAMFDLGPLVKPVLTEQSLPMSGFRVHGPINRSDYSDEYVVFQGASYFRAVGRMQGYGISARGLAINTARPEGEEFPLFRAFWIEKPKPSASELVVHALLDSPSTTGAYQFAIRPGANTVMDVEAILFPRGPMTHFGLAPMTSMFLHGPAGPRLRGDFRPAVHDSEGLSIHNGSGERIWRPLINPRTLQASAFVDRDPKGFGLVQRDRNFASFQDLEARYERRPSLWVEPRGAWGEGTVELLELPTDEEIHDNIVAFWRPSQNLKPGEPHEFAYRLTWGEDSPSPLPGARVLKSRVGSAWGRQNLFVVDFDGPALRNGAVPTAEVTASAGTVANPVVKPNSDISGVRCSFELNPGRSEVSELRLLLKADGQPISETWLYRWTKT